MNAAIRAVALIGRAQGLEVVGVERGYRGLLDGAFRDLSPADVGGILREGGTVLGSTRCPEFLTPEARAQARQRLRDSGLDGVVVIGGNGTLAGGHALGDQKEDAAAPAVVAVPASIDNDIGLTRMAIGVDTAVNTIVDACDKILDTASAHDRTFLVEVMGRQCGYLAMSAYVATGANYVLFPEEGVQADALVDSVVRAITVARQRRKSSRALIIVAEGVPIAIQDLKERVDQKLASSGDGPVETRVTVLGHVVRGGRPSGFDRILAGRLGNVAVRALVAGHRDKMASWLPAVDLTGGEGVRPAEDPHCALIDTDAALRETQRLLDGTSPAVSWRARAVHEIEEAMLL